MTKPPREAEQSIATILETARRFDAAGFHRAADAARNVAERIRAKYEEEQDAE